LQGLRGTPSSGSGALLASAFQVARVLLHRVFLSFLEAAELAAEPRFLAPIALSAFLTPIELSEPEDLGFEVRALPDLPDADPLRIELSEPEDLGFEVSALPDLGFADAIWARMLEGPLDAQLARAALAGPLSALPDLGFADAIWARMLLAPGGAAAIEPADLASLPSFFFIIS